MEHERESEEAHSLLYDEKRTYEHRGKQNRYHSFYILAIFFTNLTTFVATASLFRFFELRRENADCSLDSSDRPLYAKIDDFSRHTVKYSAFSLHPNASLYTSPPSKEVDEAWTELGVEYSTFVVPVAQGPAFRISDEHVVIPSDAPGMNGKSGYAVDMEAMHQLHCLNLIRKGQFFNYPHYSAPEHLSERPSWAFRDPEANIKGHINHCIDALRERIMCAADHEVLPYYWRTDDGLTISDFAVERQCKNFDNLRSWAKEHQMEDWGKSYRLTTPEHAYIASDILEP